MLTYEVGIGEHIDRAIAEMRAKADATGSTLRADFNGVDLVVAPGADPAAVHEEWKSALDRKGEAYRSSPEGRAAAAKREQETHDGQVAMDELIAEMRAILNAEDVPGLIRWLDRFAEVGDDISVHAPTTEVVEWFTARGYLANVNTGADHDPGDPENVARYLIGQGIDGIASIGAPHPIFRKFAAEWLADRSPAG